MFQFVSVHELFRFGNGFLATPSRSVSVAGWMKVFFKDRLDDVHQRLLYHSVSHGGDSQWSGTSVWFGYLNTSDGAWFIFSGFEFQMKSLGVFMELSPIVLDGYPIDSGSSFVFLHLLVGYNQILFIIDFVNQTVVFLHLFLLSLYGLFQVFRLFCMVASVPFHSVSSSPAILLFPVPTPLDGRVLQTAFLPLVVTFPLAFQLPLSFLDKVPLSCQFPFSIYLRPFASFQAFGFENSIATGCNVASAFAALCHYYGLICNLHHINRSCLSTCSILLLLLNSKDDTDLPGLRLSA